MLVRDVMTPDPLCASPTATLGEALDLMSRYDIHELPVTDGDRLAGILTQRDLLGLLGVAAKTLDTDSIDQDTLDQLVEEVMTTEVEAVREWTGLGKACRMLAAYRVGSLPVVDKEQNVVGLLSVTDVLGAAAEHLDRA